MLDVILNLAVPLIVLATGLISGMPASQLPRHPKDGRRKHKRGQ
jgi:hypothetical protein